MFFTVFTLVAAFFCITAGFFWYFMFFRSWVRFLSALFGAAGLLIVFAEASFLVVSVAFIIGLGVTQYASSYGGLDEFLAFKRGQAGVGAGFKAGVPVLGRYEFDYRNDEGVVTRRKLDVFRIYYSKRGDGYIDGFCHKRQESRTFRLDRVFGDVVDLDTGEVITLESL